MNRWSRLAAFIVLIALAAAIWQFWPGGSSTPGQNAGVRAAREIPVVLATVQAQTIPISFPATGTVEAIASIPLRARVDGEVTAVHVPDGASVKAGDAILDIDARAADAEITGQRALVDRESAALEKAERDFARAETLVQSNVLAKVARFDAGTVRALAKANLATAKAKLAQLESTRAHYTLRAPADGRIGKINARPGTWLKSSDSFIATLVSFDPVYVAVGVPQNLIADTADATAAKTARFEVTVPGREEVLTGPITVIENAADPDTGLITVRAEISNPGPRLWPGQITDVRIVLAEQQNAIVIPNEAVQTAQDGTFVYVTADGIANKRPVKIARSTGGLSIVAEGLKAGEQVVTDGQLQLTDKARITVKSQAGS
jgi:membrane fusion protein, multidrug efflux system